MRSNVYFTSLAVSVEPSWHLMPSLRVQCRVTPSSSKVGISVSRHGTSSLSSVQRSGASKTHSETEEEPELVDFCMSRPSLALDWPKRRTFFFSPPSVVEESELEPPQAAMESIVAAEPATAAPLTKLRRVRLAIRLAFLFSLFDARPFRAAEGRRMSAEPRQKSVSAKGAFCLVLLTSLNKSKALETFWRE